jgi:prephenate dehydrogenase
MTSDPLAKIAVIGTGLIGTSIALAAARAGIDVAGWDPDDDHLARAGATGVIAVRDSLADAVSGADLVVVCAPIVAIARTVEAALAAAPTAVVTDAGSIKGTIVREVVEIAQAADLARFVPGHPMGGSERSGPEHASASIVDGIVWVVAPTEWSSEEAIGTLDRFVSSVGAQPVRMTPQRHDRLVAFVSHLPQVASTSLMGLAAAEEADEPDLLLLAAGGFRDLTRLASSNAALWSEILIANREQISAAIDLYVDALRRLRADLLREGKGAILRTFEEAKSARVRLATKPQVRAGMAVLQVEIPDRPGALARITAVLGEGEVNIEDLQIVHAAEGGRGRVHLTVAAPALSHAVEVLEAGGYDPFRLA